MLGVSTFIRFLKSWMSSKDINNKGLAVLLGVRQPELWTRPRAELRARLHRFIPALYVLGGELVPPPQVPE